MIKKLVGSWVARGLGTGAVASIIDHVLGLTLAALGVPTRFAAMGGKTAGAIFSYFAHRRFTFRDHDQSVVSSGAKYVFFAIVIGLAHGQVTVWLRDGLGLPYLVAALAADLLVVTPSWLVALRFVIFPKASRAASSAPIDSGVRGNSGETDG